MKQHFPNNSYCCALVTWADSAGCMKDLILCKLEFQNFKMGLFTLKPFFKDISFYSMFLRLLFELLLDLFSLDHLLHLQLAQALPHFSCLLKLKIQTLKIITNLIQIKQSQNQNRQLYRRSKTHGPTVATPAKKKIKLQIQHCII